MPTAATPIDSLSLAKKIYSVDPDWHWNRDQVQVFTPFEQLPVKRVEELVAAANAFDVFVNTFERDLPISMFGNLVSLVSRNGVTVDTES